MRTTTLRSRDALIKALEELMPLDALVVESFRGTRLNGPICDTIVTIGVLEQFCRDRHVGFRMQTPESRELFRRFITTKRLFFRTSPHAKDACAHLLAFMVREKVGIWENWREALTNPE